MIPQQKLLRTFKLIRLLNTPPYRTVPALAPLLDITPSTVYRYIELLEELGYPIMSDDRNRYYLDFPYNRQTSGTNFLESDETLFLQDLLLQTGHTNPLAQSILHKLNKNYSLRPLADQLPKLHASTNIAILRSAINLERRVILQNYLSLSSDTTSDRIFEPLEIDPTYTYVLGWDVTNDRQGQFKIERIESIELLEDPVTPGRTIDSVDLFGFTGDQWINVALRLSERAFRLLVEENPACREYITSEEGVHYFKGKVRDFRGIGRYVLSLPGEIKILAPENLKIYLRGRIEEFEALF